MIKPCYRKGCKNVLCDRYSTKYGYICDECFTELSELVNNSADIHTTIFNFMKSDKYCSMYSELDDIFKIFRT